MKNEIIYTPPPDKSITIRWLVISSISNKKTVIINPLFCDDTINTIKTLQKLGVKIKIENKKIIVWGKSLKDFKKEIINVGESALLLNLILPILINQKHTYKIYGKKTILRRSFKETITSLSKLGAKIEHNNFKLPFKTFPSKLKSKLIKTSSAQVKSLVLISGIYIGKIKIKENLITRDHTEIILKKCGCKINIKGNLIELKSVKLNTPNKVTIVGDISNASPFITLAILIGKKIIIKNCGVNPRRTGFLKKIKEAGIKVKFKNKRIISGEKVSDIFITPSKNLKGLKIKRNEIPYFIDEFMLLCLILGKAKNASIIYGVDRLKNKESDRLKETINILKKLGVRTKYNKNKLIIYPVKKFKNPEIIDTKNDHRIAMLGGILKKIFTNIKIKKPNCVKKTYPSFFNDIGKL